MLIKASRITNLTDARYFAAKEVDFLGFNLEEGTEGFLEPMYMKAIREWVEGPKIVGEFSRSTPAYVREAATFFGLDAVQVTPQLSAQLSDLEGLIVFMEILSAEMDEHFFQQAAPFVSWFLIKMESSRLSEKSLLKIKNLCSEYPVLIQTDAPARQFSELLETLQPAGLSLVGGEEEQVGVKSFDEIEAIFDLLEK